ncbi:unnamed protein product [Linum trigynum]|uniref:Uncharacterized protein n=1 Tax=Linum trigynum TaxID=586398 RepID=A0AAV2DVE5_9ROSI
MAALQLSGKSSPRSKPPNIGSTSRTVLGSSSPNGKSAKEIKQLKKRVRPLDLETETMEAGHENSAEMDTVGEKTRTKTKPNEGNSHGAWQRGSTKTL